MDEEQLQEAREAVCRWQGVAGAAVGGPSGGSSQFTQSLAAVRTRWAEGQCSLVFTARSQVTRSWRWVTHPSPSSGKQT